MNSFKAMILDYVFLHVDFYRTYYKIFDNIFWRIFGFCIHSSSLVYTYLHLHACPHKFLYQGYSHRDPDYLYHLEVYLFHRNLEASLNRHRCQEARQVQVVLQIKSIVLKYKDNLFILLILSDCLAISALVLYFTFMTTGMKD